MVGRVAVGGGEGEGEEDGRRRVLERGQYKERSMKQSHLDYSVATEQRLMSSLEITRARGTAGANHRLEEAQPTYPLQTKSEKSQVETIFWRLD